MSLRDPLFQCRVSGRHDGTFRSSISADGAVGIDAGMVQGGKTMDPARTAQNQCFLQSVSPVALSQVLGNFLNE